VYFDFLSSSKAIFLEKPSGALYSSGMNNSSSWWFFDLGRRLWLASEFILWPLKVVALLMEIAIGAIFLGAIGLVIAWWYHVIPDQYLVTFINALAGRGLAILREQDVYHIGMLSEQ
jgi:hypothetical protein